jgi:hypothetical protein
VTLLMMLYAIVVRPSWGQWNLPATVIYLCFPLIVAVWHLALMILVRPRLLYVGYGVLHCLIFAAVWPIGFIILTSEGK